MMPDGKGVNDLVQCVVERYARGEEGPVNLRNVAVPEEHDQLKRPWSFDGSKFNSIEEYDEDRFHQAPAKLDWVIVGGESGPGARPMHPDWARSIRDQCVAAKVPFFFKQWGAWAPGCHAHWEGEKFKSYPSVYFLPDGTCRSVTDGNEKRRLGAKLMWMDCVGKKAAGRMLDDMEWNEMPNTLTVKA